MRAGGIVTFPRLVAGEHEHAFAPTQFSSGIPELDEMLGGGLSTGSTTLLMGPAGVGKSILAAHYAVSAAREGQLSTFFVFDEERETLLRGTASVGIPLRQEVDRGRAQIRAVNPAELSPGEFVHLVRDSVEQDGARVVVIDSLNGYLAAMPEESMLGSHLRELFSYLRQRNVLTLATMAVHGVLGHMHANIDVSYLADAVVLLRFFEHEAALHRAISVVKQRGRFHEAGMRELTLSSRGVSITPLPDLRGVLTGVPEPLRASGE
jgi:circadian clock protein KaiC